MTDRTTTDGGRQLEDRLRTALHTVAAAPSFSEPTARFPTKPTAPNQEPEESHRTRTLWLAAACAALVLVGGLVIVTRPSGDLVPVQTGLVQAPSGTGPTTHPRFLPSALPPWVRMSAFFDIDRRGGRMAVWSKPSDVAPNGVAQVTLWVAGADEFPADGFAREPDIGVTSVPSRQLIDVPPGPAGPGRTIPARVEVHGHEAIPTYGAWPDGAGTCCFSLSWTTGTGPAAVALESETISFDELLAFAESLPPVLDGWLDGSGPMTVAPDGFHLLYLGPTPSAQGGPYVRWADDPTGRTGYTLKTADWASFDRVAPVLLRGRAPDIVGRDGLRFGWTTPETDPRSVAGPHVLVGGRGDVTLELTCSGCTREQLEAVARSLHEVDDATWRRFGDSGVIDGIVPVGGPSPDELATTGEVSGRLLTVGGPATTSVAMPGHVTATPADGGIAIEGDTDAGGRYLLRLPAGHYRLTAASPRDDGGTATCSYGGDVFVVAGTYGVVDLACEVP